jgi:hypothetical protein
MELLPLGPVMIIDTPALMTKEHSGTAREENKTGAEQNRCRGAYR